MQIAVPDRVKLKHGALFASILFLAQQLNGTTMAFSLLTMLYVCLFVVAFNLAGGMVYPSGAWIFFNATLSALVGLTYKNLIGEPGQSNLESPLVTLGAYCGGMAMMGVAAYLTRKVRPRKAILSDIASGQGMRTVALGCLVVGSALNFFSFLLPYRVYTAISQINRFTEMAILLGVFYELKASNGLRSTNWIVWAAAGENFFIGVVGFTKEGMFAPLLAWLLPCVLLGYRFTRVQIVGILLTAAFFFEFLAPYSQIARRETSASASFSENLSVAGKYLSDLGGTRKVYQKQLADEDATTGIHLYNTPQGLFDRLEMLAFDDALITETDRRHELGLGPTYLSYLNMIPRVFYPSKPTLNIGNAYAREIGMIPDSDTTTGISFSPVGDAYHQLTWYGVFLLLPGVVFLLFVVSDSLAGDVRASPWGMLLIVIFAHIAPEGMLDQSIHMTLFGPLMLISVALLARYLVPVFTRFFLGGNRTEIRRTQAARAMRSAPIRLSGLAGVRRERP